MPRQSATSELIAYQDGGTAPRFAPRGGPSTRVAQSDNLAGASPHIDGGLSTAVDARPMLPLRSRRQMLSSSRSDCCASGRQQVVVLLRREEIDLRATRPRYPFSAARNDGTSSAQGQLPEA